MEKCLTVSEAARALGAKYGIVIAPKILTDLFYRRDLDDSDCPIVGGRRLIPVDYMPVMESVLRRRGYLSRDDAA